MQDSFNARMQGQSPASITKQKTGKGWMILSVILFILLIGGGVFAGMVIVKGNRDTNRLSEVENELKEKETKIAELENNEKQNQSDEMIRLADTGIYLKYPTTIEDLSYKINVGWTESYYTDSILTADFTGYDADDTGRQNKLDFADINKWSLATLNVYSKRDDYKSCEELEKEMKGQPIEPCYRPYEDDHYYVEVVFPQDVISKVYASEAEVELEKNTTMIFLKWITDPDNYVVKR